MRIEAILAGLKEELNELQKKIERLLDVFRFALDGIGLPLPKEFGQIRQFRDDVKKGLQLAYPKSFNFTKMLETMIREQHAGGQARENNSQENSGSWWDRLVKVIDTGA